MPSSESAPLPDAGDGAGPAMAGVAQAVEEYEAGCVLPSGGHHYGFRHVAREGGLRTLPAHALQSSHSTVSSLSPLKTSSVINIQIS